MPGMKTATSPGIPQKNNTQHFASYTNIDEMRKEQRTERCNDPRILAIELGIVNDSV